MPTNQSAVSDEIKDYLGEAMPKGTKTSDESFWREKCRLHFNDDYKEKVLNKENSSSGWYTIFLTAFEEVYRHKSKRLRKIYSLIREWKLEDLKKEVQLHELQQLLFWLKKEPENRFCGKKPQDLLDCFFSALEEKELLKCSKDRTLFHWAIFCNQSVDVINKLIEKYGYSDRADSQGQTPLHYAVKYNHLNAIAIFLKANANVNAINKEKLTPLTWATKLDNRTAISILSRARSQNNSLGATNNDVPTPLQTAVETNNIELVCNLVAGNKNVSQFFDKKGNFIPTKESHPTNPRIEKFLKFTNAKNRLLNYVQEVDKRDDDDRHWSVKIWGFTFFGGFGCTAGQKKRAAKALKETYINNNPVSLIHHQKAIHNGRLGSIYKDLMETAPYTPSPSSSR
jgi:Ankyrin repeats (3 copies)